MPEFTKKVDAQKREMPEPWEGNQPVPWLVLVLIVGLFIWALSYIWFTHQQLPAEYGDRRTAADFQVAASDADDGGTTADGGKLYAAHCVACHQANGAGVPGVFPPLAKSEWVEGEPKVLVQILLHGISGELTVGSETYNGMMPAFNKLSDNELAALASHVRTNFGNSADAIDAAFVKEQRDAIDRDEPWQGDADLNDLANP